MELLGGCASVCRVAGLAAGRPAAIDAPLVWAGGGRARRRKFWRGREGVFGLVCFLCVVGPWGRGDGDRRSLRPGFPGLAELIERERLYFLAGLPPCPVAPVTTPWFFFGKCVMTGGGPPVAKFFRRGREKCLWPGADVRRWRRLGARFDGADEERRPGCPESAGLVELGTLCCLAGLPPCPVAPVTAPWFFFGKCVMTGGGPPICEVFGGDAKSFFSLVRLFYVVGVARRSPPAEAIRFLIIRVLGQGGKIGGLLLSVAMVHALDV